MNKSPLLFIVFNRSEIALQTLQTIRQYRPEKLFIAADGPRDGNLLDINKCSETRARILEAIDWPCEVKTNFQENNLGCKLGPITAINWFFENEEMGIILEDDCVPDQSFFTFCEGLLNMYKDDERIMLISGNNYQRGRKRTDYSYYFSKQPLTWGWATWRRAWEYFEDLKSWPECKINGTLDLMFDDSVEEEYWTQIWDRVYSNNISTAWDYQWMYSCRKNNGLTIIPEHNLVSNIGFGEDATHTKNPGSELANIETKSITLIKDNPFIIPHKIADQFTFDHHFGGNKLREKKKITYKIKAFFRYLYRGSLKHMKRMIGRES